MPWRPSDCSASLCLHTVIQQDSCLPQITDEINNQLGVATATTGNRRSRISTGAQPLTDMSFNAAVGTALEKLVIIMQIIQLSEFVSMSST